MKFYSWTKVLNKMDISGIFPPIPTPFNEKEDIDYEKLKENVEKWNEIPFKGTNFILVWREVSVFCTEVISEYRNIENMI